MSTTVNRKSVTTHRIERIALGSDRAAKIMAVRASIARIAEIDAAWRDASVVARPVKTDAPAMPLTDWELMSGARQRALAVRDSPLSSRSSRPIFTSVSKAASIRSQSKANGTRFCAAGPTRLMVSAAALACRRRSKSRTRSLRT